jgi:hypothetical protein
MLRLELSTKRQSTTLRAARQANVHARRTHETNDN